MKASTHNQVTISGWPEREILEAIRGILFGFVEIIVHDSRVTEIRQTHRMRMTEPDTHRISTDPLKGG